MGEVYSRWDGPGSASIFKIGSKIILCKVTASLSSSGKSTVIKNLTYLHTTTLIGMIAYLIGRGLLFLLKHIYTKSYYVTNFP